MNKDQSDDLPFEFKALELALELTCMSLDAQVKELELEIYPVLDELAKTINTFNLERVRRFKGHLLALTQRVQKVCDEIEHLMDDNGDMAEMYPTENKEREEAYHVCETEYKMVSKSESVSPVGSISGMHKLQRALSSLSSSKHESFISSGSVAENIDQLEMLLEAYFVVIDSSLNKLLSGNVQNQLIQFELLLTAATFVATIFPVVAGIFGMNFEASIFDYPNAFNWVLIICGVLCGMVYVSFLLYFRHKKVFPL